MKETTHKISVIVPCYNQGKFLDDCINSLLNQSYENWECILVNDGSTDDTEEKSIKWSSKDKRIHYYKKTNGGLSSTRNFGVQKATGDFVQFLDCDDFLTKDKFSKSLEVVKDKINTIVITNFNLYEDSTKQYLEPYCIIKPEFFNQNSIVLDWDKEFTIPIHCGLFSIDLVKKYPFDESLKAKEDWIFWIQVFGEKPSVYFIDETLLSYRMSQYSMTKNDFFMHENKVKAINKLNTILDDQNLLMEFYKKSLLICINENFHLKERVNLLAYKRTLKYKINKVLKVLKIKNTPATQKK